MKKLFLLPLLLLCTNFLFSEIQKASYDEILLRRKALGNSLIEMYWCDTEKEVCKIVGIRKLDDKYLVEKWEDIDASFIHYMIEVTDHRLLKGYHIIIFNSEHEIIRRYYIEK